MTLTNLIKLSYISLKLLSVLTCRV